MTNVYVFYCLYSASFFFFGHGTSQSDGSIREMIVSTTDDPFVPSVAGCLYDMNVRSERNAFIQLCCDTEASPLLSRLKRGWVSSSLLSSDSQESQHADLCGASLGCCFGAALVAAVQMLVSHLLRDRCYYISFVLFLPWLFCTMLLSSISEDHMEVAFIL